MNTLHTKEAKYWHVGDDGKVVCDLCPRGCRMKDGARGYCGGRGASGDRMVLFNYGQITPLAVDPIEKKPLFHFLPGSEILSFGTQGCNMGCIFCQNWHLSKTQSDPSGTLGYTPQGIVDHALRLGVPSIAFTYNEPIIFLEFALDVARLAKQHELNSVAVSAGYIMPDPRREFFQAIDAVNVDLKGFSPDFYRKNCAADLEVVKQTLLFIRHQTKAWLEITTLLIEGENDSDEELWQMTRWIKQELGADVPLHFSAFHPAYRMLDKPMTTPASLHRAQKIAHDNGLLYVYLGNVHSPAGGVTACPACGKPLIERCGYVVKNSLLWDGAGCKDCGISVPGIFARG